MRIKEMPGDGEDPINMTPMIDMVFLLLIFFLVATTFATEERDIAIQLPNRSAVQPLSEPPKQVIINIKENGEMWMGGEKYDEAAMRKALEDVLRNDADREVLVRADERSLHKYFAAVASLCRSAGVNELKIGYLLETPRPVKAD